MLGSNLTTDHLFPLSVNPGTISCLYNSNRLVELKTLIAKNRGGINARRKMPKVILSTSGEDGQSMDIDTGISWESCESMKEVMEGVEFGGPRTYHPSAQSPGDCHHASFAQSSIWSELCRLYRP